MQCFPIKTSFTVEFLKENLKELNFYVLLKWERRDVLLFVSFLII